jgi:hypothetical protein
MECSQEHIRISAMVTPERKDYIVDKLVEPVE